jgi:chromosome partitioning protein
MRQPHPDEMLSTGCGVFSLHLARKHESTLRSVRHHIGDRSSIMVAIISCLSQKGGVAKSALARLVAREYAAAGRRVMLADLDTLQSTSLEWSGRRLAASIAPAVPTQSFESIKKSLKSAEGNELLVLDGRGFADRQTAEAAAISGAVLLPTGTSVDDLRPSVRLAHELIAAGLEHRRLVFALCRTGDSARENDEAGQYIRAAGYHCLPEIWPERAGYRQAHDEGRTATEARHPSLRAKAQIFADRLTTTLDKLIWEKTP